MVHVRWQCFGGYQIHAADRTLPWPLLPHLGVHRAGIDRGVAVMHMTLLLVGDMLLLMHGLLRCRNEVHAADRALTRVVLLDPGMHRTGVHGCCGGSRRRGSFARSNLALAEN